MHDVPSKPTIHSVSKKAGNKRSAMSKNRVDDFNNV